jgi:hypothetical protein
MTGVRGQGPKALTTGRERPFAQRIAEAAKEDPMDAMKASEIAHALYRVRGDRAEYEAARKEQEFTSAGNAEEAENWRAIRGSIRRLRGANES